MIRYDNTIAIARPPAEVFDLIVDVPRAYEWTDMTDGRWISDPPIEVGARAEAKLTLGPVRPVIRWDVTRLEPPRVVSFRTPPGGPLDWDATYVLEEADGGTRVHATGEVKPRGWLRLLTPLIRMELPKGEARELARLKGLLEGSASATVAGSEVGS